MENKLNIKAKIWDIVLKIKKAKQNNKVNNKKRPINIRET